MTTDHADLGSACAKAYDFAAAQRWFDEAVRISPTPVPALNAIGHAWLEVRNYEAAQAAFAAGQRRPAEGDRVGQCAQRQRQQRNADDVGEAAML